MGASFLWAFSDYSPFICLLSLFSLNGWEKVSLIATKFFYYYKTGTWNNMGVKITELLKYQDITFSDLEGKIIAVDASNILLSFLNFSPKNTDNIFIDKTQRVINHLYGLLYRIHFFYSIKVLPLFCFDGKISELKRIITKDQLNDYLFTKKMYRNAMKREDYASARQIAMSKEFLWSNVIEESKKLLSGLGVPYIESPSSAEAQCAYLVKNHHVDYMNSQDFDSLLFGSPYMIQNVSKSLKKKVRGRWTYQKIQPKLFNLEDCLIHMNINYFQFIDLALLLKTDYFHGIKGIGPHKALKLIKLHGSIENLIKKEQKNYDFNALSPSIIKEVRKIFLFPDVIDPEAAFTWTAPIRLAVQRLLCKDHHLNTERVYKNLDKLIEKYHACIKNFEVLRAEKKKTQLTLDQLF